MKKKRGFTLVELLAVIVILAIILVVAMLSVNKIINKSKLEANLISAKVLVKSIKEDLVLNDNIKAQGFEYYSTDNDMFKKLVDGSYPDGGVIVMYNNTLIQANLCYKDQSISYDFDGEKYKKYNDDDFCKYETYSQGNDVEYVSTYDLNEKNKLYGAAYLSDKAKKIAIDAYEKSKNNKFPSKEELDEANGDNEKTLELYKKYYANNVDTIPYISFNYNSNKLEELKRNSAKLNSKIEKVTNIIQTGSYPSRYVLSEHYAAAKIKKDQGNSGLCWAFATTTQLQNNLAIKSGKNENFSERHLDYFTASDGFVGIKNPYSTSNLGMSYRRIIADGGDDNIALLSLFSGMTLQTSKNFGDTYNYNISEESKWKVPKESTKEVFDPNNLNYYVRYGYNRSILDIVESPNATLESIDSYLNMIKGAIKLYGGVTASIDADADNRVGGYDYDNDGIKDYIFGKKGINSWKKETFGDVNHTVTLIGWDDTLKIENTNLGSGYWIARNSWDIFSTILIPYGYFHTYITNFFYDDISKKDFDNSYNSYNVSPYIKYSDIKYMKKVSNKKEQITGFSSYVEGGSNNDKEFYIIDATNIDECKKYKDKANGYKYYVNNNDLNVYDTNGNIIGAKAIFEPKVITKGYYVVEDDSIGDYIFNNNYCVLSPDPVTIYTNNTNIKSSLTNDVSAELVSKDNISKNHAIDVAVNNKIGNDYKVDIVVKDSKGNNVTYKCIIEDNKLINNVAHIYLTLPDSKKYNVYAKYNLSTSDPVLVNGTAIDDEPNSIDSGEENGVIFKIVKKVVDIMLTPIRKLLSLFK